LTTPDNMSVHAKCLRERNKQAGHRRDSCSPDWTSRGARVSKSCKCIQSVQVRAAVKSACRRDSCQLVRSPQSTDVLPGISSQPARRHRLVDSFTSVRGNGELTTPESARPCKMCVRLRTKMKASRPVQNLSRRLIMHATNQLIKTPQSPAYYTHTNRRVLPPF
jgi:hypothetical protein